MSDPMTPPVPLRNPYVGIGADGARRSAQIDLEEAGALGVTLAAAPPSCSPPTPSSSTRSCNHSSTTLTTAHATPT